MNFSALLPLSKVKLEVLLEIYKVKEDYLRSLQKKTKINPSLLHRVLGNLVQAGVLTKEQRGKEIYYSLIPNPFLTPLLEQYWKYKMGQSHQELQILFKLVYGNEELLLSCQQIYLFGSLVSGEVHKESDIDLLFVTNHKKIVLSWCREVSAVMNRSVNPFILTPEKFRKELGQPLLSSIVKTVSNRIVLK